MKKIKLIAALLSALFLTGCVDQSGNQSADNDTKQKRIVATSVATCEIRSSENGQLFYSETL